MKLTLKIIVLLIIALSLSVDGYGQKLRTKPSPVKPKDADKKEEKEHKNTFQAGAGIMSSVIYLSRNLNDKNDARGITYAVNYGDDKLFRVSAQFTKYFPIDMAPTWYDIKATSTEINLEKMVLFKNGKTILYPLTGLSYNTFKGYFTGFNDYLNLRSKYKINTVASSSWLGLNVGSGIEHAFGPVVLFVDYKMRIGRAEGWASFMIMDVCYSGGVRFKLKAPTLKKIFRGVGDRYHWF